MRSKDVDKFNHDPWADEYDSDVQNESDPIRAGYAELLAWVAHQCSDEPNATIVELGSGTGNLTAILPVSAKITCVDTSTRMMEIAKNKLAGRDIVFEQDDILTYVTEKLSPCDLIVSTYALHHLTGPEKKVALSAMVENLNPGGRIVMGDLMFENPAAVEDVVQKLEAQGHGPIKADIEEEHFWVISDDWNPVVASKGEAKSKRFSLLSWGLCVTKQT